MEDVFYVRPPGIYRDRQGDGYEWTRHQAAELATLHMNAACDYGDLRGKGVSEEHARCVLPTSYFQNVLITGNARSCRRSCTPGSCPASSPARSEGLTGGGGGPLSRGGSAEPACPRSFAVGACRHPQARQPRRPRGRTGDC